MKWIFDVKASNRVSLILLVATVLLVFTLPFLEDLIDSESGPDALQETFRFLFPLLFAMGSLWVLATLYLQVAYTWQITRGLVPRPRLKALSGLFFLSLFVSAASAFLLIIDNGLTATGDLESSGGSQYSELFIESENDASCGLLKFSPIRSLVGALSPEDGAIDESADDLIRLDLTYFLLDQTFKGRLFRPAAEGAGALESEGTYSIRSRFFNRAIKAGIGSNAFVYLINDDDLITRLDAGEKWKPKEDFKMGVLTPIGEIDLPTIGGNQGTSVAVLGNRGLMVGLGFSGVTIKKAKGG